MRNVLLAVAGVVLVLVLGLLGVVSMQPDSFRVERKVVIAAPAAVVQGQIVDFRKWDAWSPWDKRDPKQKREYSGATSGVGAIYSWNGNDDVGAGSMTIRDVTPERVAIDLHFTRPFEDRNLTAFELKPAGEGTEVTWSLAGQNNFMSKAMSLFMSMDKMIGPDFEQGLGALKPAAEAEAARQKAEAEAAAAAAAAAAPVGPDGGSPTTDDAKP